MRPRKAPVPPVEPVTDAEVARLLAPVQYFPDWLTLDDEPEQYWGGASLTTRLEHLARTRVMDACWRARVAERITSDDLRRVRDVDLGVGIAWGPHGEAWLRAYYERRWPSPEVAA